MGPRMESLINFNRKFVCISLCVCGGVCSRLNYSCFISYVKKDNSFTSYDCGGKLGERTIHF